MTLVKDLEHVLEAQPKRADEQTQKIAAASALFDDLVNKGLIEPASYKLAPLDSTPSQLFF
ncbi:hypothetical protein WT15_30840 [Burkholderia stagnalis]|uniref:hypothetical protein n=1 Tax=Burkholderia stagnalis TaxID=1503054 RepID=UPI0007544100|nr:hypothetical protein [Burkholderia stagnalis]KVN69471.1 hypothetical protein WT15_30840 [Burkholderia stagnalis]KWO33841.1 hypothetical protein WT95_12395 [Burkholderia stagnalis]KWO37620.1 hypothetical protein WT96_12940 [Burkholderia stagnalis]